MSSERWNGLRKSWSRRCVWRPSDALPIWTQPVARMPNSVPKWNR
jgi:hypothetical protein